MVHPMNKIIRNRILNFLVALSLSVIILSILPEQPRFVTRFFMRLKWEKEHINTKELLIGNAILKVPPHWYIKIQGKNNQAGVVNYFGIEKSFTLFLATKDFYYKENSSINCVQLTPNYSSCRVEAIENNSNIKANSIYYLNDYDIFIEITQVKGKSISNVEYEDMLQLLIKSITKE